MSILYFLCMTFFLILCIALSFIVLIQESKTTGLGASFGGDTGDSLFGVSTPQILKVITAYMAAVFIASCLVLSFWTSVRARSDLSQQVVSQLTNLPNV